MGRSGCSPMYARTTAVADRVDGHIQWARPRYEWRPSAHRGTRINAARATPPTANQARPPRRLRASSGRTTPHAPIPARRTGARVTLRKRLYG